MHVSNEQLQSMLSIIPDSSVKKQLNDIVSGKIVKEVYCNSKKCKNRLIAQIYSTGKVIPVKSDGRLWLRAHRNRFDKYMGFECWCGNDTRVSPQEKGIIGENPPTKGDLEELWHKLQDKPSNFPLKNKTTVVESFTIKELM